MDSRESLKNFIRFIALVIIFFSLFFGQYPLTGLLTFKREPTIYVLNKVRKISKFNMKIIVFYCSEISSYIDGLVIVMYFLTDVTMNLVPRKFYCFKTKFRNFR